MRLVRRCSVAGFLQGFAADPSSLPQRCAHQRQGQAGEASQDLLSLASSTSNCPRCPVPKGETLKELPALFCCLLPSLSSDLLSGYRFSCTFPPPLLGFGDAVTTTLLTARPRFQPLFSASRPIGHTTSSFLFFSITNIRQNTESTRRRPAKQPRCVLGCPFLPASGFPAPGHATRCTPCTAGHRTGLQPSWGYVRTQDNN